MNARLISYSQPFPHIHSGEPGIMGLDNIQDLIAYCARVSNPSNQANTKTTAKLLDYLITHKHWSPFEMASACIEIETTRDIARQLIRHRSFSFQEFSQRYANINDLDGILNGIDPSDDYLCFRGIMAIPSNTSNINLLEKEFSLLNKAFISLKERFHTVDTLSMGMSNDYHLAMDHGSTMIRVGSKIFGERI